MSSVAIPTAQEVRDRLEQMVGPLRREEQLVASEIEAMQIRLTELRAVHTDLKRAIRSITGEPVTSKNGQVQHGGKKQVSEKKIDEVYDWLLEHRADYPDGFAAYMLWEDTESPPVSSATQLSAALRRLHEQSRIVLDRVGNEKSNRTKIFKLPPQ